MNKKLLQAAKGLQSETPPFWLMRQAGRYLPEYRVIREKAGGFMQLALNPDWASEVTVQPIRRFGMDGAILFSDILMVPYGLGQDVAFKKGEGPVLPPIRTEEAIDNLCLETVHEKLSPIYGTVRQTRDMLTQEGFDQTTMIGFAGSPWTVATYMVEGGSSKSFENIKAMAYGRPAMFQKLIDKIVGATVIYLRGQIDAGAEIIKLFDSWAGACDVALFEKYVIGPTVQIVKALRESHPETPLIGFPRAAGVLYPRYLEKTALDVLALDQSVPWDWAHKNMSRAKCLQGNLDPFCLLAGGEALKSNVIAVKEQNEGRPFIFNLGHGINKETPIAHVEQLADLIRS